MIKSCIYQGDNISKLIFGTLKIQERKIKELQKKSTIVGEYNTTLSGTDRLVQKIGHKRYKQDNFTKIDNFQ